MSGYTSELRHVSTIGKKLLNSNISSTCIHNMVNFGSLTAKIGSRVLSIPANFKGFRVLPSLLQRRRSPEASKTARCFAVSWAGTLYIHFRGSCALTEFCQVQNPLYDQVLRSPILAALLHCTPAAGISQTLRRGTRNEIRERSQRALFRLGGHHVRHQPTF